MQADTAVHGVPPMPTGKEAASDRKKSNYQVIRLDNFSAKFTDYHLT